MHYVYSTLASDQNYAVWTPLRDGSNYKVRDIMIKGGAQVAEAGLRDIITPLGVVTRVSDEDAKALEQDFLFNLHRKNGFIKIESIKEEVEKVVSSDMQLPNETQGAPLTDTHVKKTKTQKGIDIKVYDDVEQ